MKNLLIVLVCLCGLNLVFPQTADLPDSPWHFLDTQSIRAFDFLKTHPTYDGRGVLIIICDSGVDMGVLGLLQTSDGKTKVIDAQDFSGQGDIPLKKAAIDSSGDKIALKQGDLRLYDFAALPNQPADAVYWLGCLDEKEYFQNANATDINNNGRTDDKFGLVTFPIQVEGQERWVYFIDENGDGSLRDEKPRFDYKYNYDTFSFTGRDAQEKNRLYTFVVNIRAGEKIASFHACDNSHGTHCAGIAAGFQLFGETSLHGIAPGAQVMSCKIGVGFLAGGASATGAMQKAYEYGVAYAKEHNIPVVFSMSYGIDSEIEGRSDMENFLDKIMAENEKVLIVTSNGNAGPGISSSDDPACAARPMSAGALLPLGSARDTYGFANDGDRLFHFTARGGEYGKPDVVAPGAAASSVPQHAGGENMWGTSMACPQVAGAAAVLISACLQENIPWTGALIKRAIVNSALPLPGYTALDLGAGVVNIPRAFEILKTYSKRGEATALLDYSIETFCPTYADGKGINAYWRAGGFFPTNEKQNFTVSAIFPEAKNADARADFYRAYNLKCDQPWFVLDKTSTYIRGDHKTTFGGYYQADLLREPGLYVATISGYPKSGAGQEIADFRVLNTVIIPHRFDAENGYKLKVSGKILKSGLYHRYFVQTPPGASAMTVKIAATPGKFCGAYAYVYDPDGIQQGQTAKVNPDKNEPVVYTVSGKDLTPGVWEIIPFAYHNLPQASTYDLEVSFDGLELLDDIKLVYENGATPQAHVNVINHFEPFKGTVTGSLTGYGARENVSITGDTYERKISIGDNVEQVKFKLVLEKETWGLFTDIAVNIVGADGKFLVNAGFSHRVLEFTFKPPQKGEYTLQVIAAFALTDKKDSEWRLMLDQSYFTKENVAITAAKAGEKTFSLYPGLVTPLQLELAQAPRLAPDGFSHIGLLEFKDERGGQAATVIPITF